MVNWEEKKKEVFQFVDFWNKVWLGVLVILSISVLAISILFSSDILSAVLIIVTGLYAFTTFNQMREARKNSQSRPVQRDIDYSDEYSSEVPGLRNFGSESVYDLEFLAVLEPSNSTESTRRVTKLEKPISLKPGEFEPVIGNVKAFKEDLESTSKLEGGKLSLYYAYSTPSVPRIPSDEKELLKKDLSGLQEKYPDPTFFDASALLERCFSEE